MRIDYELGFEADVVYETSNAEREICSECGKYCYSQREAGIIINQNKKHHSSDHLGRNKKLPKRKYWCKSCGQFHLTSMPFYNKESVNAEWENRFYRMQNGKRSMNCA